MSNEVEITTTINVKVDMDMLVQLFCAMTDDEQSRFICLAAAKMEELVGTKSHNQWWYVGSHLRSCECSTDAGREMVREIVAALDYKQTA